MRTIPEGIACDASDVNIKEQIALYGAPRAETDVSFRKGINSFPAILRLADRIPSGSGQNRFA
jgi:hypothetical protein